MDIGIGGRKTVNVTVPFDGRDKGKIFQITEKPALQAAKWGDRMFLAIKGTGGYVPPEMAESLKTLGIVGVAICGLNAILAAPVSYAELGPLLDELLECVKIVRDPKTAVATPLMEEDIQEVATVNWLRSEVLRVHTGFSFAEAFSAAMSASASILDKGQSSPST